MILSLLALYTKLPEVEYLRHVGREGRAVSGRPKSSGKRTQSVAIWASI